MSTHDKLVQRSLSGGRNRKRWAFDETLSRQQMARNTRATRERIARKELVRGIVVFICTGGTAEAVKTALRTPEVATPRRVEVDLATF